MSVIVSNATRTMDFRRNARLGRRCTQCDDQIIIGEGYAHAIAWPMPWDGPDDPMIADLCQFCIPSSFMHAAISKMEDEPAIPQCKDCDHSHAQHIKGYGCVVQTGADEDTIYCCPCNNGATHWLPLMSRADRDARRDAEARKVTTMLEVLNALRSVRS